MLATIIILLVLGVVAIGLEFFLPGGILGIVGIAAIAGAIVMCFTEYGPSTGLIVTTVAVFFIVGALTLWLKYFHKIGPGKDFLLSTSVSNDEALEQYQQFLDTEGVTKTDLRPAGQAQFGDKRLDVLAESGMIDADTAVRVVKVEGSRIVVRRTAPPATV